jgi:conjugal transfer ATP-binding protein TraC
MNLKGVLHSLDDWLKPASPGRITLSAELAEALVERTPFSSLLRYEDYDEDNGLFYVSGLTSFSAGFGLLIGSLPIAGTDTETQLEAMIQDAPANAVLQFAKLSSPQISNFVGQWLEARVGKCPNPLLTEVNERRARFIQAGSTGPSVLSWTRVHPHLEQGYLFCTVQYAGDMGDEQAVQAFLGVMLDYRSKVKAVLGACYIQAQEMSENDMAFLLRELLNPQIRPEDRLADRVQSVPYSEDLVDKRTRVSFMPQNGAIRFRGGADDADVSVSCITTDAMPRVQVLYEMAKTLGDPKSWEERISCPYWAYTTIHVLDQITSEDWLTRKVGFLNKQTMSDSQWYRSMMGKLFEQRDSADLLARQIRQGKRQVRAYCGINLYTHPDEHRLHTEYVKSLWRRAGFRAAEELHITLPVFIASLPGQYDPDMDPPGRGLNRATRMHNGNAAGLAQVQGDWMGSGPQRGGMLLMSRRGQLATFDVLDTDTNFNFAVVAQSGSGKSYFAVELLNDFISKGGRARVIDVGRSYFRFIETIGGQNLVFSPNSPISLNPFYGIKDENQLHELVPMAKDLIRQMAYPATPEDAVPAWEYAAIEHAILGAWKSRGEATGLADVHAWLVEHADARSSDLAFQLEPYATGRYAAWFNGPRQLDMSNPALCIELEEVKQDPQFQAVLLTLLIYEITKEMYLSDISIPKVLLIDEAWDLMGNVRTGKFIETAFRRARKYNGIVGVITQSFEDFEKSEAARAAIANASWLFALGQKAESVDFAAKHGRLSADAATLALIKSVKSGEGFSEMYVRGEKGSGVFRLVTDRHSYYLYTTRASDKLKLANLQAGGLSLSEAIDKAARDDYTRMWGSPDAFD